MQDRVIVLEDDEFRKKYESPAVVSVAVSNALAKR